MNHRSKYRKARVESRTRRFRLEALEPRLVLAAIVDPALDLVALDDSTLPAPDSPATDSPATDSPGGFDELRRFASAEELQKFWVTRGVEQNQDLFGKPAWQGMMWLYDGFHAVRANQNVGLSGDFAQVASYSGTNVQVAGVDEGDLVKTDGEYLYVARENRVTVIDARDPANLQIVTRLTFEKPVQHLFVDGDRLTVMSQAWDVRAYQDSWQPDRRLAVDAPAMALLPHDRPVRPQVEVEAFDIQNRSAPISIGRFQFDGNVIQSRAVGSQIVLVTQSSADIPRAQFKCDPATATANGPFHPDYVRTDDSCVYETEQEYVDRMNSGAWDDFLPRITIGPDGSTGSYLIAPDQIAAVGEYQSLLVATTVIDVGGTAPIVEGSAGVLTSYTSAVYATASQVYLATPMWQNAQDWTSITALAIGGDSAAVRVAGTGTVSGRLLNQFAMDEFDGYLRIATTSGWGPDSSSNVYVLQLAGDKLETVGSVNGITPGESLFAARFLGDRAFLVTFERIDPLIAVDLTDPAHPAIRGELEIPGFSNYLHPFGEGFLIGFGQDADPGSGTPLAPQLSLFDVNDLSTPTLIEREVLQIGPHAWSPAFFDHHAIQFYEDVGILAVPFQTADWWMSDPLAELEFPNMPPVSMPLPIFTRLEGTLGEILAEGESIAQRELVRPGETQGGLRIFRIDPAAQNPIHFLGRIAHRQLVDRTVRIGNALLAISGNLVTAHDLSNPELRLDELFIGRVVREDRTTAQFGGPPVRIDVLANDHVSESAKITAVTAPVNGGQVSIDESGRFLIYSPPEAPTEDPAGLNWLFASDGHDHFQYTVDLGGGAVETGRVDVHLLARIHDGVRPDHFRVRANSEQTKLDVLANDFVGRNYLVPPTITHISAPDHGGEVTIAENGLILLYRPAEGFVGTESFTYSVGDETAHVSIFVIGDNLPVDPHPDPPPVDPPQTGEPLISVRLSVTDLDGNAVSTVELGDTFLVKVLIEDLRDNALGVFSAYLDLPFDQQLAGIKGTVTFSSDFPNGPSEMLDSQGFNELGAFAASVTPPGSGERLLGTIEMEAIATGVLVLRPNPADESPQHDFLLYGVNGKIDPSRIEFSPLKLEIVNSFHNDTEPADTNGDGFVSPSDALQVINYLNEHGAGTLRTLRTVGFALATAAESLGQRLQRQFDANGDGFCTHMDVLSVINRINRQMRSRDEAGLGTPLATDTNQRLASGNVLDVEGEATTIEIFGPEYYLVDAAVSDLAAPAADTAAGRSDTSSDEFAALLDDLTLEATSSSAVDALLGIAAGHP